MHDIYLLPDINKEKNKESGSKDARKEEIDKKLIECETFVSRKEISIGTWSETRRRANSHSAAYNTR